MSNRQLPRTYLDQYNEVPASIFRSKTAQDASVTSANLPIRTLSMLHARPQTSHHLQKSGQLGLEVEIVDVFSI